MYKVTYRIYKSYQVFTKIFDDIDAACLFIREKKLEYRFSMKYPEKWDTFTESHFACEAIN